MDARRHVSALLGALALLLLAPGAAAGASGPGSAWAWPLAPPPAVVARFAAPAGPYSPGHRGVDLAATAGSRVLAAGAGVVAFAGRVAGRGVVSVDHGGGLRTTYEPVVAAVTRGDHLKPGDLLGVLEAAPSHCPPAACLHWGLRRGSSYLDPLSLLGPVRVRLLPVWGREPVTAAPAGLPAPAGAGSVSRSAPDRGRGRAGSGAARALAAGPALSVGAMLAAGAVLARRRGPPRAGLHQSSEGRSAASRR